MPSEAPKPALNTLQREVQGWGPSDRYDYWRSLAEPEEPEEPEQPEQPEE